MLSADEAGGRLTIDAAALRANYHELREAAGGAECAAVVKANGYGLGIANVVRALVSEGCRTVFVARASEGVAVREIAPSLRIFVLDGVHEGTLSAIQVNGLIPVLGSMLQLGLWREAGGGEPCAVHVDTGMNRLGLRRDECASLVRGGAFDGIRVALLMTHPACADRPEHPLNAAQRETFGRVRSMLPDVPASYCNSAALLGRGPTLDLVRPGIALYGGEAIEGGRMLRPVVALDARIVQRRDVPAGETVGYGATWRAERDSRLAICAVGYADGLPRASGTGVPVRDVRSTAVFGALCGHRVPIVGRVSMDLTTFDITDVPIDAATSDDHIELIGPNVTLDDVARAAGTIGYEILTSLGPRYSRTVTGF